MSNHAYTNFLNQKNHFFEQKLRTTAAVEEYMGLTIKEGRKLDDYEANLIDYRFIAPNKTLIEQEFNDLFVSMEKKLNKQQENDELWAWAYFCCRALEIFYNAQDQKAKAQQFAAYCQQIKNRIDKKNIENRKAHESFLTHLRKKISAALQDLVETPAHLSLARNKIAYLNVCRLWLTFYRLTLSSGLRLARDTHVLEKLDKLVGHHIDAEKIIHNLELPNSIFRALSVGFFAARFILDSGALIKHTFFPSEEEKLRSRTERFLDELYKRHCNFLNDIVWSVVNGVTNYNTVFHIAAPVAGWITAGFLVFDVGMIMWRRFLAQREFQIKRDQYRQELEDIDKRLKKTDDKVEQKSLLDRHESVRAQLRELELKWEAANSKFLFNATAASLLVMGFSASLLFTPPGMVLASYALCTIAIGMYLSADAFGDYREKSLRLQEAVALAKQHRDDPFDMFYGEEYWADQLILDDRVRKMTQEFENARHDFIFAMVKNTVMPALIIGTFAICWQAALVMVAAYAVYELVNAYVRYRQQQAALPQPENGDEEQLLLSREEEKVDDLDLESMEDHRQCCFA